MKRRKWLWKERAALAAASVLLLSGCSVAETLTPVGKGEKEYGKAETMVILSTERLRYEQVYTDALWDAAVAHRMRTAKSQ